MGMRGWVGVISVAVLTVFAGAAPALGTSALLPTGVISGARASEPAVAVSADGRTLAAWVAVRGEVEISQGPPDNFLVNVGHGRIEARLGSTAHRWGRTETLGTDGEVPIAAVGSNGTAAVAWCTRTKPGVPLSYVRIASPGRRFGPARLLSARGTRSKYVSCPDALEVQPDGRVVLVRLEEVENSYQPPLYRIQFALLRARGGRPLIGTISREIANIPITAAETEAGDVLLGFEGSVGGHQGEDLAQLRPGARHFDTPQGIRAAGETYVPTDAASVSAGPGGAALAFEAGFDLPSATGEELDELDVAEQQPNGAFSAPVAVFRRQLLPKGEQFQSSGPRVALPAGGAQVATWLSTFGPVSLEEHGPIVAQVVMAAVRPAGAKSFQAPVQLSVGPGRSGEPLIAAVGAATVVLWAQHEASCKQRVYASLAGVGTSSAQVLPLSGRYRPAKGECAKGNGQLVLAGSSAGAIAGWVQNSSLHITTIEGGVVANTSRAARASSRPSAQVPGSRR
jgi:hypothetical protein